MTRRRGDTETRGNGDKGTRGLGDVAASPDPRVPPSPPLPISPSPHLAWLGNPWLHVALIVLVAAFFRLWLIDRIPPGLFGDEATDGLDALDVLAGRGAVFFPANFGREGLHMWIVAGMFRLLGVTPAGPPPAVSHRRHPDRGGDVLVGARTGQVLGIRY